MLGKESYIFSRPAFSNDGKIKLILTSIDNIKSSIVMYLIDGGKYHVLDSISLKSSNFDEKNKFSGKYEEIGYEIEVKEYDEDMINIYIYTLDEGRSNRVSEQVVTLS